MSSMSPEMGSRQLVLKDHVKKAGPLCNVIAGCELTCIRNQEFGKLLAELVHRWEFHFDAAAVREHGELDVWISLYISNDLLARG